jgi:hypothetical protein
MDATETITRAMDAFDKVAAAVGQTAAEYWPQWVGRCVLQAWLSVGMWGLAVLTLGVLGVLLMKVGSTKLDPVPDPPKGDSFWGFVSVLTCIAWLALGICCIPFLLNLYDAIVVSAYPEIYAAEVLLETITGH